MRRPFLDRPLRNDPILRIYAFVVVMGVLLSARDNVELGGAFNPDRLRALMAASWDVTVIAALLAIIPLLVRYVRRVLRGIPAPGTTAEEVTTYSQRPGEWTNAGALRLDIGTAESKDDSTAAARRRAPELRANLDSVVTFIGNPVELTWKSPRADHVLISALPGEHPASGTVQLHLERGGDVVVTAINEHGHRIVRTPYVRVLPVPQLTAMAVPRPPALALSAHVQVNAGSTRSVAAQLDAVLDRQAQHRAGRHPGPEPVMTMAQAVERVRSEAADLVGWRPTGLRAKPTWPPPRTRRLLKQVPSRLPPLRTPPPEVPPRSAPPQPDTILQGFSAYGDYTPAGPSSHTQQGRSDR